MVELMRSRAGEAFDVEVAACYNGGRLASVRDARQHPKIFLAISRSNILQRQYKQVAALVTNQKPDRRKSAEACQTRRDQMRSIITSSNLRGTVKWLREYDDHFKAMDDDTATADLVGRITKKFRDLSLEQADTDTVHESIWRGVFAIVGGGADVNHAADQREVVLYVSPDEAGQSGWVEVD